MLALAVSVGLSSLAIGAILSTALLIGPAAAALRLTKRVGLGAGRRLPDRRARHLARRPAGLRQLLLGIGHLGLPVSFFIVAVIFVTYLASGLPGGRTAARSRRIGRTRPPPQTRQDRRMSQAPAARKEGPCSPSFMINAWTTATIVAVVAGVVGYFVVLRGSAFPAHAIPKGAFAGAAGASLLGISTLVGLAVFSLLGALGDRRARPPRPARRRHRPRAGHDARPRRRVPVPDHRVRAGDLLPALRRDPRRQHQRDPAGRRPGHRLHRRGRGPLPAAHALLRRPRDSRGQGHPQPPHRDLAS